jgi:prepilin-type N-terminal cleavage/methylation domain-containing protein
MRRGFTLIEILVVIVVIAVLAGLVAPNVFKHVGEAKYVAARSQIEMLGTALDATASTTAAPQHRPTPYKLLPILPGSYNSNSYAHGLANAAGFAVQRPEPATTPGWGHPVERRFFGP